MIKAAIEKIVNKEDLTYEEAYETMNEIMISTVLCNILIGCFCVVVLSWAVVAIQTVINDFRREKREEKKAAQDDEYHQKRMSELIR